MRAAGFDQSDEVLSTEGLVLLFLENLVEAGTIILVFKENLKFERHANHRMGIQHFGQHRCPAAARPDDKGNHLQVSCQRQQ